MIEIISSMMNASPMRAIASLFDQASSGSQEPASDAVGLADAAAGSATPGTGIRFGDAKPPVGAEAFMNF